MDRLTVGELAQASGLSPATIRRYGAAGLLVPALVDAESGYRWYSPRQIETAVLARTLRQLEVPLEEVKAILDAPDAAARLVRLEEHWGRLHQRVERGREERDHLARLFSGYQEQIDSYHVVTGAVATTGALMRRRVVPLSDVPELTRLSLDALTARARAEGRQVVGDLLLRYGWPAKRYDVDNTEALREVEVCLPVDGPPDVVLPGGTTATTEVEGDAVDFPRRLAAYGAVSQWARAHRHRLVGPALEWWHGATHVTVGWVTLPRETAPTKHRA